MEATSKVRTDMDHMDHEVDGLAPDIDSEMPDRILNFTAAIKERMTQAAPEPAGALVKRDWSSALDLVNEAFEAIRMAETRAVAAEEHRLELVERHAEQLKTLEMRLVAAEKRAEAAETRAKTAEGWLSKFHDTIVDEFERTFTRP